MQDVESRHRLNCINSCFLNTLLTPAAVARRLYLGQQWSFWPAASVFSADSRPVDSYPCLSWHAPVPRQ